MIVVYGKVEATMKEDHTHECHIKDPTDEIAVLELSTKTIIASNNEFKFTKLVIMVFMWW